jgi:hypothetical protein
MSIILTELNKLHSCITECKSWITNIEILSTHFCQDDDGQIIPNHDRVPCRVNTSNFLCDEAASDILLQSFCSSSLKYPCSNCLIEIEGFVGVEKESDVVSYLKNAAIAGGTIIVCRDSRVSKG